MHFRTFLFTPVSCLLLYISPIFVWTLIFFVCFLCCALICRLCWHFWNFIDMWMCVLLSLVFFIFLFPFLPSFLILNFNFYYTKSSSHLSPHTYDNNDCIPPFTFFNHPLHPSRRQPSVWSVSMSVFVLDSTYKWNLTVFFFSNLFYLAIPSRSIHIVANNKISFFFISE